MSYADVTYANAYLATIMSRRAAPWTNASLADKLASLEEATNSIDVLNFGGHQAVVGQANQFPRGGDTEVPDMVKRACCELALALIDDVDANAEMENLANAQQGMGAGKVVRDTSYAQEHIRNGIPSLQAWMLLKTFLRDPLSGDASRA